MSSSSFVLQGIAAQQHDDQINELLSMSDLSSFLAGVAFVKHSGVRRIGQALGRVGDRASFFVGIRNDITSYQGIAALLEAGAQVWVVDTATRRRIYHPKLYLGRSAKTAKAVIGSANLTAGGLGLNVEASVRLDFDLRRTEDSKVVTGLERTFDDLPGLHPKHVFRIKGEPDAARLLDEGRLIDERVKIAPAPAGPVVRDRKDVLSPMKLVTPSADGSDESAPPEPTIAMPASAHIAGFRLLWMSKGLTERDLNIPTGRNTHNTGSMGLKRGAWNEAIDHRHYFRGTVFAPCAWATDPKHSHLERTSILCELKVKGIWHGLFALGVTHNRDITSRTYAQKNFMTHLIWGEAKPLIARRDLLGRQLSLYRDDAEPARPRFLIEID